MRWSWRCHRFSPLFKGIQKVISLPWFPPLPESSWVAEDPGPVFANAYFSLLSLSHFWLAYLLLSQLSGLWLDDQKWHKQGFSPNVYKENSPSGGQGLQECWISAQLQWHPPAHTQSSDPDFMNFYYSVHYWRNKWTFLGCILFFNFPFRSSSVCSPMFSSGLQGILTGLWSYGNQRCLNSPFLSILKMKVWK